MKSKLYCKILVIGIIALFVGVSVSSGFAVEHKLPIINIDSEDDCIECQSNSMIKILEILINKIEKCEGLSYVINSMKLRI